MNYAEEREAEEKVKRREILIANDMANYDDSWYILKVRKGVVFPKDIKVDYYGTRKIEEKNLKEEFIRVDNAYYMPNKNEILKKTESTSTWEIEKLLNKLKENRFFYLNKMDVDKLRELVNYLYLLQNFPCYMIEKANKEYRLGNVIDISLVKIIEKEKPEVKQRREQKERDDLKNLRQEINLLKDLVKGGLKSQVVGRKLAETKREKILELLLEGITQEETAEEVGVSQSYISILKKQFEQEGLL